MLSLFYFNFDHEMYFNTAYDNISSWVGEQVKLCDEMSEISL